MPKKRTVGFESAAVEMAELVAEMRRNAYTAAASGDKATAKRLRLKATNNERSIVSFRTLIAEQEASKAS